MPEGPEIKLFTLEEVKVHNGKDDPTVWFVYKDSVYDVTNYLDDVSPKTNFVLFKIRDFLQLIA